MNLPYIINVAVILLACLAFYKLLLRRETFYKVNRFFLIACLAISFALPLVQGTATIFFAQANDGSYTTTIIDRNRAGATESTECKTGCKEH
jgi:hypothetical protein